jgi:hypothetical protein
MGGGGNTEAASRLERPAPEASEIGGCVSPKAARGIGERANRARPSGIGRIGIAP